ncbi:MAG TPA: hypothetical protein VHQ01_07480, partial [Pyrinomonadaceae bacterium]|nr:hypothetical protein [Pyrinomonadaceae bacterium]
MEKETFLQRMRPRLEFFARYWVGTILLIYAAPKLMGTQFRVLESVFDTPLAQVSDFSLAWSFFARSYTYQMLLGCAELTIGFMLIFRRTKTLGALCSLPITINIIMVDIFFSVATGALVVAATLLIGALYLLFPEIPRLKAFFWDTQKASASGRTFAISLIYGIVVFAGMIGLIMYVARISPRTYDGKYK